MIDNLQAQIDSLEQQNIELSNRIVALEDADGDGGSIENDADGDGITDEEDNSRAVSNEDQNDFDNDGIGNECDEQWQQQLCDDEDPTTLDV